MTIEPTDEDREIDLGKHPELGVSQTAITTGMQAVLQEDPGAVRCWIEEIT